MTMRVMTSYNTSCTLSATLFHVLSRTYSSSHGGQLSICVVGRSDFNDISGDQVDALKTPNDSSELACSPATSLRSTSSRRDCSNPVSDALEMIRNHVSLTCRVKCVDVDAQIHGLLGTNPIPDLLDDTICTNLIDLTSFDDLKATVPVVLVVGRSRQRRADAGVDI